MNNSAYIFQQAATPNANADASEAASHFFSGYDYRDVPLASTLASAGAVYVTENIPDATFDGNRTCLEVDAVYTPKQQYVIEDVLYNTDNKFAGFVPRENPVPEGSTLYYVSVNNYGLLFIDRIAAYRFVYYIQNNETIAGFDPDDTDALDPFVGTYTDGTFPFRINFSASDDDPASCRVIRNNHYSVEIKDLSKIPIANVLEVVAVPVEEWEVHEIQYTFNNP